MAEKKVYLPQQKVRRGTAGYKGENVVVVGDDGKPVKSTTKASSTADEKK